MILILNGVTVDGTFVENESEKRKISGEERRQFEIKFKTNSSEQREWAIALLKEKVVTLEIPDSGVTIEANVDGSTYSFRDQETSTYFTIKFIEHDPEDTSPKKIEDIIASSMFLTMHLAADNWKRTRAISELLIEKGIFTEEEHKNKFEVVFDRDHEEIIKKLSKAFELHTGINISKKEVDE